MHTYIMTIYMVGSVALFLLTFRLTCWDESGIYMPLWQLDARSITQEYSLRTVAINDNEHT